MLQVCWCSQQCLEEWSSHSDLRQLADDLGLDSPSGFHTFLKDLWHILAMKVKGTGASIIRHVLDTKATVSEEILRATTAWFDLENETGGM